MKLTAQAIETIDRLKSRYIEILMQRSQHADDFDANVTFLRHKIAIDDDYTALIQPWLDQLEEAPQAVNGHHCYFFQMVKVTRKTEQLHKAINEAHQRLNSSELHESIDKEFAREPRILLVGYLMNSYEEKLVINGVHHDEDGVVEKYFIKFSDDSLLTFTSLTDPAVLDESRVLFNKKMEALAAHPYQIRLN